LKRNANLHRECEYFVFKVKLVLGRQARLAFIIFFEKGNRTKAGRGEPSR